MNAKFDEKELRAASADVISAINLKRVGGTLSPEQLNRVVGQFMSGRVPDYQIAAWLATVACMGLSVDETMALTKAYIGDVPIRKLSNNLGVIADKHSTGGVGDKTTLVVAPVLAACGVPIAKLSGRGLGYAGGTIDKLESIEDLRLSLSTTEAGQILEKTGMVIGASGANLAPGDAATYYLRDVTGTVESIPLIAASIVSKKVAFGADVLILDVKTGSGALIADIHQSRQLAELMQAVAERFGLRAKSVLSDMSQPLGRNVGNRLEVAEAIYVLQGRDVPGLTELCVHLAAETLCLVEPELDLSQAEKQIRNVVASGKGYEKFVEWATAQGGDYRCLDDIARHPGAASTTIIRAEQSGWIGSVTPRPIGEAALHLGAGRLYETGKIDPRAGIEVFVRVGNQVSKGDTLAIIHSDAVDHDAAAAKIKGAIDIVSEPQATIDVLCR